ncbi:ABC transporter permease [Pedobacter sp.]|uniref:ABC transporter permease n=1 Tax=Pedobacter sp. TaxID=1411316 RepID=UPI00396CFDBB
MNTALYIARRYLFAKKSTHAINIISGISALGVFVGSAALIIILSVFNGLEQTVLKMVNTVTPQIVIEPDSGKTFNPQTAYFSRLEKDKAIYSYTEVLSDNVLLWYKGKQTPAVLKGVSSDFLKNKSLDSIVFDGSFVLENPAGSNAVIGAGLQAFLGVNTADPFEQIRVFSPKKGASGNSLNPLDDFNVMDIPVAGIFEVQQDFDNVIVVPLNFARTLLGDNTKVSAIEINVKQNVDAEKLKKRIAEDLKGAYKVKNRVEQNQALHNVLTSEKWISYIILTFVLIIAIFNIIGSLTMLVIDKQKDISVLSSLGAGKKLIRRIFLAEGMMITLAGCIFGLLLGLIFCLLQQHFGWIKMGEENIVLSNAYPIAVKWQDFVLVFITVGIFSFLASKLASNLSVKKVDQFNKDL